MIFGLPINLACAIVKLDFFVVGVQKGGTSALASYLKQHPDIEMSHRKELHFFDDERLDWTRNDYDGLHRHFDWSLCNVRRGEATPVYIYWPPSLQRLHRYNADAKLIVALRHPVYRAHSHWRQATSKNLEILSFEQAITEGRERVSSAPGGVHRRYSYVERGLYADQVERLFAVFPRNQVHVLRTDSLWSNPEAALSAIEDFLNVFRYLGKAIQHDYIVPLHTRAVGSMSAEANASLRQLYEKDIKLTAAMTGLDLSDWLDPKYSEPMAES